MTPINRILFSKENMCVEPLAPEEQVCRAETPQAPLKDALDFRKLAHQRYAQSILLRDRSALTARLFSGSSSEPSVFNSSPLAFSGWTVALGNWACSGHGALSDKPPPGDPMNPDPRDDENPTTKPGNDAGTTPGTSLASSECQAPADLDSASDTSSLLMTCSDTSGDGLAKLERVNISTGDVEPLLLPDTLENEPTKAVYLTSAASQGTGVAHVGFAARGSDAQFTGGDRSLANSGIFRVPEADVNATSHVLFDSFQRNLFGEILSISLAGLNGTEATVNSFSPNTPVSMIHVGNQLFALTRNVAINPRDGSLDLAPATILAYDVDSSGELTAAPVGAVQEGGVIAGTSDKHNAYLLEGTFNPTAIGATEDGRLVVVSQGIPGENATSIQVLNADFTSGITSGAGSSEIVITDAANPDFDFVANSASQVSIAGNLALVGSADGSGRVAVVDISAAGPSGGAPRVRFVKAFDDGSDIANIVVDSNSNAYAISDSGQIRSINLTAGANFGKVGEAVSLANVNAGSALPAALRAGSIVVAHPGGYSKASVQ